jgi:hypothetical protein
VYGDSAIVSTAFSPSAGNLLIVSSLSFPLAIFDLRGCPHPIYSNDRSMDYKQMIWSSYIDTETSTRTHDFITATTTKGAIRHSLQQNALSTVNLFSHPRFLFQFENCHALESHSNVNHFAYVLSFIGGLVLYYTYSSGLIKGRKEYCFCSPMVKLSDSPIKDDSSDFSEILKDTNRSISMSEKREVYCKFPIDDFVYSRNSRDLEGFMDKLDDTSSSLNKSEIRVTSIAAYQHLTCPLPIAMATKAGLIIVRLFDYTKHNVLSTSAAIKLNETLSDYQDLKYQKK